MEAAITFVGLFVFLLGASTRLYGRFKDFKLADFLVYRYSKHPQYLGFVIWSYGLLIFVSYKTYVRGAIATPLALIWLASAMLMIALTPSKNSR